MLKIKKIIFALFILSGMLLSTFSQDHIVELTKGEKETIIAKTCSLLKKFYVIPEMAEKMAIHINKLHKKGTFKNIVQPEDLAKQLTRELRLLCNDKHLHMYLGSNPERRDVDHKLRRILGQLSEKRKNYGLDRIQIYEGNVGYMSIHSVMHSKEAMMKVDSAMTFLSNTDAIIFDLRVNNGGDEAYMAHLFSYFFEKPTHINSLYWRSRDRTDEIWTGGEVPGKKMVDVPLFVLISKNTFSGGEAFAYELQTLKRAVIIGEVSAGGANPSSTWVVYKNLRISIPHGRAISPVTGTNWEGVGVKPDIVVSADKALKMALKEAKKGAEIHSKQIKDKLLLNYKKFNADTKKAEQLFDDNKIEEGQKLMISSLKRAVKVDLMDRSTINELGYSLLGQDKRQLAIAVFIANTLIYPENVDVYDSLGEAYLENGNKELAIKYYKKALKIDPKYPTAIQALKKITGKKEN